MKRLFLATAVLLQTGCFDPGRDDSGASGIATDGEQYFDDDDFPGNCGVPNDTGANTGTDSGTGTDGCDTDGTGTPGSEIGTTSAAPDPSADQCTDSSTCDGGFCVAPFVPSTEPERPGTREAFACEFTCVPNRDDSLWCADDAGCCSETARCTARGYCIEP